MKRTQKLYHLPLSGQLVGEIFNIIRIPYPDHLGKDMQRYFRGERIHDDTREEILYLLVDGLLKDGVLPYADVFKIAFVCHWGLRKTLVRGISEYAERWDSTCAKLRYWEILRSQKRGLLVSCLRLAVIDLALRWASFRFLSKLPPVEQTIPLWAKRGGNRDYLKQLKERCSTKPSNTELADAAGVQNDKTTAGWFYRGKRPSREHMQTLARAFTERMQGIDESSLLAQMNRHYALAALCERLSANIDWDGVMELVSALYHQTSRLQRYFERDQPAEKNYSFYLPHFLFGAGRSFQAPWLKHLWDTEKDTEWKRDFVCVERDWAARIVQENFQFTGENVLVRRDANALFVMGFTGESVPVHQNGEAFPNNSKPISTGLDFISASYIDHMIDGEMALWGGAGPEAYDWDKKTEAQFRRAVDSNPDNSRAHLNLGAYLGQNWYNPSHIEEGFRECCRASELRPTWDLPRIEAANILLHVRNYDGALTLLDKAAQELKRISPRLAYTIGFARMMNGDFEGALSMFEKASELKPDYALAFDNAAFCSFHVGKAVEGRRYAKSARQLGISTTYDMYDVGKTKQEPGPFPFRVLCETVPCHDKECKERSTSKEASERLNQWVTNLKSPKALDSTGQ